MNLLDMKHSTITIENEYSDEETEDFSNFIKKKRNEYNYDNIKGMSTKELAYAVGIDYEMFRKIINKQKPTKKRDFIIAVGIVLKLSSGEINEGLWKYDTNMSFLNEENSRDKIIIKLVNRNNEVIGTTIKEVNDCLINHGYSILDIHDKRENKNTRKRLSIKYKIVDLKVNTTIGHNPFWGDQYNSLCTEYNPSRYFFSGVIVIRNRQFPDNHLIRLFIHSDGSLSSISYEGDLNSKKREKNKKQSYCFSDKTSTKITFRSIEETKEFKPYFIKLQDKIDIVKEKMYGLMDDTKNYSLRSSARLIGNKIVVFAEEYCYEYPELGEYYVLTYSSGKYQFYVYSDSAFMRYYLSPKEYKKYYNKVPETKVIYNSIEELNQEEKRKDYGEEEITISIVRRRACHKLKEEVDKRYHKIIERKEFIQNLDYIFDSQAEVLGYYKIDKDFDGIRDDTYGFLIDAKKTEMEYRLENGKTVVITYWDICRAFELGFETIEDICRIKGEFGSIEYVLE